jgi:hypothetical protein
MTVVDQTVTPLLVLGQGKYEPEVATVSIIME